MTWNNPQLDAIQQMEYQLIDNPSGSCPLFTNLIHSTSEWIDKDYQHKEIHISPYKVEFDKAVDLIAYYIECGYTTNESIEMIGKDHEDFRSKLTNAHQDILRAARKQRKINKNKNN